MRNGENRSLPADMTFLESKIIEAQGGFNLQLILFILGALARAGLWVLVIELAYLGFLVPVQYDVPQNEVMDYIVNKMYGQQHHRFNASVGVRIGRRGRFKRYSGTGRIVNLYRDDDRNLFPLKNHLGAKTKVNVWFKDVFKSLQAVDPLFARQLCFMYWAWEGCFNDQASAMAIWLYAAKEVKLPYIDFISSMIKDDEFCKNVNILIKTLGVASKGYLNLLVECISLRGRGIEVDPDSDLKRRTNADWLSNNLVVVPKDKLRDVLLHIYKQEVRTVSYQEPLKTWTRRWAWCQGGGQTKRLFRELGVQCPTPNPTRRDLMEMVEENLIAKGEPKTDASLSWKLEQGKSRAIYSCDTVNYSTFHYLLDPVEKAWRGVKVILNPGSKNKAKFYNELASAEGTYVMLDYDDFNSQHENEAMAMVIDVFTQGAPEHIREWAMTSFYETHVHSLSGIYKVGGTLMSGHRATSFINSILNYAYLLVYCPALASVYSLHTGDDVIIKTNNMQVVSAMAALPSAGYVRCNPSKQSIGQVSGEFLRVNFNTRAARGYTCRCIGSLVSGNWTKLTELDQREYVSSILQHAWTVRIRSGVENVGLLMSESLRRRVPALWTHTTGLLTGAVSLDGSPLRPGVVGCMSLRSQVTTTKTIMAVRSSAFATRDYLANHTDHKLLTYAGIGLRGLTRAMLASSHSDMIKRSSKIIRVTSGEVDLKRIIVPRVTKTREKEVIGVLGNVFPLTYLRSFLTHIQLLRALKYLNYTGDTTDIGKVAWGIQASTVGTVFQCDYSTLRYVSKMVNYPCRANLMYPVCV